MKPTSIIFLIVSLVLVIAGFTVAGVAKQIAAAEGIDLNVRADEDKEAAPFKYEYGDDSIGKIKVDVRAARVNIIGGAEKAYVELTNFTEGMYRFSSGNRVLEINDDMDISSLSGIASLATNFRGLRSFISYYNMRSLTKTVTIYVCDANPVNVVEISLDAGDVSIRDITASTDYNIEIDAGDMTMVNVNTTSAVSVNIDAGKITVDECSIKDCELDVDIGDISVRAKTDRLDADIDAGNFNLEYMDSFELVNLNLYAIVGTITVDGENIPGYIETDRDELPNVIDVSVSTGNIVIDSTASE